MPDEVNGWIDDIAALPPDLRRVGSRLSESQLDTPYRPGGWTAQQVVHHLPDSHMHSFIRFRRASTERRPMIKAYDEKGRAALADYWGLIAGSLDMLD